MLAMQQIVKQYQVKSFPLTVYRYLIGFRWMEQWKRYVGYNEKSSPGDGSEAENPGKMNNDALLTGQSMCLTNRALML